MARPFEFTDDDMKEVCKRVSSGLSISAATDKKMFPDCPSTVTFYVWLARPENKELVKLYARSLGDKAEVCFEQLLVIADEPVPATDRGYDSAAVNDKRLRIDTRKWIASKLKPRKYGDSIQVTNSIDYSEAVTLVRRLSVVLMDYVPEDKKAECAQKISEVLKNECSIEEGNE